jgi:hypothetical protein
MPVRGHRQAAAPASRLAEQALPAGREDALRARQDDPRSLDDVRREGITDPVRGIRDPSRSRDPLRDPAFREPEFADDPLRIGGPRMPRRPGPGFPGPGGDFGADLDPFGAGIGGFGGDSAPVRGMVC